MQCVYVTIKSARRYDPTNDGSLQYKGSKAIHDAGITSCV